MTANYHSIEPATAVATGEAIWTARSRWYALFASVFAAPYAGATLSQVLALPIVPALREFDTDGRLTARWQEVLTGYQVLGADTFAVQLTAEFDRLFLVPMPGVMVSLAATAYLTPEQQREGRGAWFEQLYRGLGFDWRESLAALPGNGVWPVEPEHASLILAALAIVCQEIADHYADQPTCSDLRWILRETVAKSSDWLETCFVTVAGRTREPFYQLFAEATAAFLRTDTAYWDDEGLSEDLTPASADDSEVGILLQSS
ncbi:MAG: molecular chaperone TorD family protein [Chloroflexi bacterium]|nr:molecular chaperone TorD family protein [Chloroflexota bacterium]